MIDFDSLRDKAEDFVEEHADQIDGGIDKAAQFAGKKYGHGDQIEKGADKLKGFLPGGDDDEAQTPQAGARAGQGRPGQRQPGQRQPGQGRPGQRQPGRHRPTQG